MSVIEHQAERVGKYQPYPEYNNSGYSWMAKIPSGWLNGPLKRIAYLQAGFAFKGDTFNTSEGVPIVRMNNILNSGGLSLDDAVRVPEIDVKPEFYLATGDIVMGMSGSIENIAKVQGDDLPCALNQRVGRFVLRAVDDGFLWYLIQSNGFKQQVSLAATGTAQLNISSDQVGNTLVSWPVSLLEQNIIAAFLDYETARIDRLIAKQQRLIELLKEKRQAVISHAVTKGLNPNTPMKDSGVEWLGQVPEHWAVGRYKFCNSRIIVGIAEAATHAYVDHGVPLIRSTNIKESGLDCSDVLYLNPVFAAQNITKKLRARDIVTVRTGYPGISAVVPLEFDNSQCFTNLVATPLPQHESDFLCEYLNSAVGKSYFELNAWGSAQKNISVPILQDFPVAWPSQVEEVEIVSFCKKNNEKYNKLIDTATKGIELLQERRTALISAAVTGKIDLRGWTPPADEVAV